MAMSASALQEWALSLEADDEVGIDDGGLTLVVVGKEPGTANQAWLEIGGLPLPDDEEDPR